MVDTNNRSLQNGYLLRIGALFKCRMVFNLPPHFHTILDTFTKFKKYPQLNVFILNMHINQFWRIVT